MLVKDTIYVASAEGRVVAVEPEMAVYAGSGISNWRSQGVWATTDSILVGASEGLVMRLDASSGERSGAPSSRARCSSATGQWSIHGSSDLHGKLMGFDYETGEELDIHQRCARVDAARNRHAHDSWR